ncbi:MAG: RHS repeat-associated core domain-containing protein, partial [Rhodoglobus sp.]
STWQRLPDSEPDCGRVGESGGPCGLRYIFTDYSPKPVLALNGAGAIVGVGEYTPFGEMNTRQLRGETLVRPYLRPTPEQVVSSWTEPTMGLSTQWRLNFDSFDTEAWYDPVSLKDGNGSVLASWTGHHLARHTTPWAATSTSGMSVTFSADGIDCAPAPTYCNQLNWNYSGVALRSAEYSRSESGVARWFPPIRFPGQYRDEESGLHENWNRFYDPTTGRYLSPEPMLQRPGYVKARAGYGMTMATYAYANNNPIRYTDRTGLFTTDYSSEGQCATYYWAALRAQQMAGCDGNGRNIASCSCNREIQNCMKGFDVCSILAFGQGPELVFDATGKSGEGWSRPGPLGGSTHITPSSCDWALIDELAETLLHEAMHHVEWQAFKQMSHVPFYELKPELGCGVWELSFGCTQPPWSLGRPLP